MFDFAEDETEIEAKFDDCDGCKHFGKERLCRGCEIGEFFEEVGPVGLDVLLRD